MNYLVQLKLASRPETPQEGSVFIEQFILPTLEMCKRLEAEKKIVAGGPLSGAIALALIVNAKSAEELDGVITSLPVWPRMETTVTPLSTFDVRMQAVRARLEDLRDRRRWPMNAFALFGVSVLASLVSSVVAARLVAWPRLQDADRNRALTWLVAPHMFLRFIGLSLLVPGVVSPLLPAAFAMPAAYGDFIAGMLAIVATIALVNRTTWAIPSVWLFNLWGVADFLFAFYQGGRAGLQPGMLGAAFFIVTAVVPPLLVTHFLIFGLLVRRHTASEPGRSRQLEHVALPSRAGR